MSLINQISIWVTFQLSAIFIVGTPLILLIWSIRVRNKVIEKLLKNFWKISILYFISLILFIGKQDFALLIMNISTILMSISVWFWSDINSELSEYKIFHPLTITAKVWRWALTIISTSFLSLSLNNFSCNFYLEYDKCSSWIEPSRNLYLLINKLFRFLFGGNFSEPVAKFIGLFALLIYTLGLIQWLIIKLPKTGRNSDFSNFGEN